MPKNGTSSDPGGGGSIPKKVVTAMGGPAKVSEMRTAAKRDPGKLSMFRDAVRRGTRSVYVWVRVLLRDVKLST